jgi:hypothetical protein
VTMLRTIAAAAATMLICASPAIAAEKDGKKKEKWATRIIGDKKLPVVLDPAKSYILFRAVGQTSPVLMRLPEPDEAADHAQKRAEAFAKVQRQWRRKVATIQLELRHSGADPSRRPLPPAPNEDDFGYPTYEQQHTVYLGPQNRFSKEGGSAYLQEVPPGEYIFYAIGAVCACLGTVSFEAPAGKVVAVELIPVNRSDSTEPFQLAPATFVDSRLPEGSVVPAAFKPAGPRANWYGIAVDRVNPIAGLFTYERGKQVPVTASVAAVPAPPAAELVAPATTP